MRTWKERALAATGGSRFGAIIAAALGKKIPAPCFTSRAVVTSDGLVMADYTDKDGERRIGAFVGAMEDLTNNMKGLARFLDLSVEDRKEFFAALQNWIATDYRH